MFLIVTPTSVLVMLNQILISFIDKETTSSYKSNTKIDKKIVAKSYIENKQQIELNLLDLKRDQMIKQHNKKINI